MRQLVLGILAHVDAGKTTLSEAMLYHTGAIRKLGRVDHKDTFLDTHALERSRGITIYSKQAQLALANTQFTLLDTPGHIDFSAETERALQVLDYAVLLISGTDGVQSHTETLWQLLRRYHVPTFAFINKMDLADSTPEELMARLQKQLSPAFVNFSTDRSTDAFAESLAVCGESLMTEILEHGTYQKETLIRAIADREVVPCFFGSALRLKGVEELLEALDSLTLPPKRSDAFGARVYKVGEDEQGNRLTYLKLTGGQLAVRDVISGTARDGTAWDEKVNQLRIYGGAKYQMIPQMTPGMICAVTGLTQTYAGMGLGAEADAAAPVLEPVLSYRVEYPPEYDAHTVLGKLRRLEEEDPQLHAVWNEQLGEIHVYLMGEVQLEILQAVLAERFNLSVRFTQGSIAYKETIAAPVEGIGHYEPLRHYAEAHILLEPLPRGSGLRFASDCREEVLDKNWQRLILTHLAEKTHIGVLTGAPITDMKLTLVAGRAHLKHTEGGDFRQATYRAVRHGLMRAQSVLLEPLYRFKLTVPSDCVGRAMHDLQMMHAVFSSPLQDSETAELSGTAPVSQLRGYQTTVTGYTKGRGQLVCIPEGYVPCADQDEIVAQIGYHAEADTDNPADSVFCSHGAGFVVKWDEVEQYKHVESGRFISRASKPEETEAIIPQAVNAYRARLADDKELMEIFERTYGKIRRDVRYAMHKAPEPDHKKQKAVRPIPDGPEYLLVDGYNIIYAWDSLKKLAADNLDLARSQLIHILCNYQGFKQCELILVFDAYKVKGKDRSVEQVHNIHVVYTKEAETADMYIEQVTKELGKDHRVRVATSDGMEQLIILGRGAYRMTAAELESEVRQVEEMIRTYLTE